MISKRLLSLLLMTLTLSAAERIYDVKELVVVEDIVYEIATKKAANGLLEIYFDHGGLKTQVLLKDGRSSGMEKKFYPNGQIASAVPFLDGKEHGIAKRYFGSGGLQIVASFDHGLKEGITKAYYRDGTLKSEIRYEKGGAVEGVKYLEDGSKKEVPKELLRWIQPDTGLF